MPEESIAEKVNSIFNFDQDKTLDTKKVVSNVLSFEDKTKQLISIPKTEIKTIEDKDYLVLVLKHMIEVGAKALEKIEQNIKIGSRVGEGEDFAAVLKSLTECVSKLVDLQLKLFDIDNIMSPPPVQPTLVQNNMFMGPNSSADLLDMIDKIKETSELNGIEAKFKLDNT